MQAVERKKEQNLAINGSRPTSTLNPFKLVIKNLQSNHYLKTSKVHIMLTISSLWISPSFGLIKGTQNPHNEFFLVLMLLLQ
jgi:hypothetical protein